MLYQVLDNQQVTLLYEHFDLQENIEYPDHRLVMMVEYLKKKEEYVYKYNEYYFHYHNHHMLKLVDVLFY